MSDKSLQTSFLILAALTSIDALTTLYILQNGGTELNPILAPVIDYIIPIKLGYLIVVGVLASWTTEKIAISAILVASFITLLACANNTIEVLRFWEWM